MGRVGRVAAQLLAARPRVRRVGQHVADIGIVGMVGQPGAVLCMSWRGVIASQAWPADRSRSTCAGEQTGDGRVQVQQAALLQAQRDGGGHGLGVAGGAERRVHGQRAAGGDVGCAGGNAPGTRRAGAGDAQGRGRVQREDRGVQGVGVQACSLGLCVVRHVRKARGIRCGLRALRPPSSGTQPEAASGWQKRRKPSPASLCTYSSGDLETQPMVELGAACIAVVHGQPEMSVAIGLPAPGDLAQQPFADARGRRAAAT